ncbi:hypothetical protein ACFWNQ_28220 [Streptomyces virginiae]|uniref:hypothetical protein n=1 Tax=Streptomyces virginiae TaxID=1961 RepID=UPI003662779A
MDGTTAVGVGGRRRRGSRTALVVPLMLALLLGALSVLVLLPAAQHLRSLRGGERAQATIRVWSPVRRTSGAARRPWGR